MGRARERPRWTELETMEDPGMGREKRRNRQPKADTETRAKRARDKNKHSKNRRKANRRIDMVVSFQQQQQTEGMVSEGM